MTRLVVGCPVAERAWVLPAWGHCIRNQEFDGEIEIICVYTRSEDHTLEILEECGALILKDGARSRPPLDIAGHRWPEVHYELMARLRNKLVQYVYETGADYFLSLDSDILLPHEHALEELVWHHERLPVGSALAPLVNMHEAGAAYNYMYWSPDHQPAVTHFAQASRREEILQTRVPQRVDVIMAAMLLDRDAMECRWSSDPLGEDLGWNIDAERRGINRYIWAGMECDHLMKPLDNPMTRITY